MARRPRLLPRYVKWRDGRPRWELGGAGGDTLRKAGFRSVDLKDAGGRWLSFEAAQIAGKALNAAVDQWRAGAPAPDDATLAALASASPAQLGAALGRPDAAAFLHAPARPSPASLTWDRITQEFLDGPVRSSPATTRKVYRARASVLLTWLGGIPIEAVRPSDAARLFSRLLDVGYHREARRQAGSPNLRGTAWHQQVFDMGRAQKDALAARRLAAMDTDEDLAARPPGYTSAFYVMTFARTVFAHAVRTHDITSLRNPFEKMGLSSPQGRIRYVEPAELAHIIATAEALGLPEVADAAALAIYTVQRRADLVLLPWAILPAGRFQVTQQKTGSVIDCRLARPLVERLEAALARRQAAGTAPHDIAAPILSYPTPDALTHAWARVRAQASIDMPGCADILLHDLRDTGVTRLFEAGASMVQVCQVSGHSFRRAETIQKSYLSNRASIADAAMDLYDNWLERSAA